MLLFVIFDRSVRDVCDRKLRTQDVYAGTVEPECAGVNANALRVNSGNAPHVLASIMRGGVDV